MSSAVAPGRRRRSATMIPSPTTTSAAATTSTKNTAVWPFTSSSPVERATNDRFTAFSISSTHMNITSGLRRMSRPTVPMPNSTAASSRYHVGVGATSAITARSPPSRSARPARPAPGSTRNGRRARMTVAEHGDDEQHRRDLEGEHVGREQRAGQLVDVRLGAAERAPDRALAGDRPRVVAGPAQHRRPDERRRWPGRRSPPPGRWTLQRLDAEVVGLSTPSSMMTNRKSTTIAPA